MVAYTAFGKVMRQCKTRVQRTGASLLGQFSRGTITDQTTAQTRLLRVTRAGPLAATPIDLDGDGQANASDRQVLYANTGWRANLAPAAGNGLAGADSSLRTHADLSASRSLGAIAADAEGDPLYWRVLGASHGSARVVGNGSGLDNSASLQFTPDPGYISSASITLQADDGYASSAPISVSVNVSGAPLVALKLVRLPVMNVGTTDSLQVLGDFADAVSVPLPAGYARVSSNNPSVISVDGAGRLHANRQGTAIIAVHASAFTAVNVVSVQLLATRPNLDRFGNELDLYPVAIDLAAQGGQRQIDVHSLDGTTLGADIGTGLSGTHYFISDPRIAVISADA